MPRKGEYAEWVDRHIVDENGCWIWQGAKYGNGYSRTCRRGRPTTAHRLSYEHHVGPIPEGLVLDHLCRVPLCVNPEHLEPVTQKENLRRGRNFNSEKTHCPQGHEYTPENIKRLGSKPNARYCKACAREDSRIRMANIRSAKKLAAADAERQAAQPPATDPAP